MDFALIARGGDDGPTINSRALSDRKMTVHLGPTNMMTRQRRQRLCGRFFGAFARPEHATPQLSQIDTEADNGNCLGVFLMRRS